MSRKDRNLPCYMISVVAEILGVHPQTLRLYEREGFIEPKRQNNQRLYSDEDIERLDFIIQLTRDLGVNRAGVDIILRLRRRLQLMQAEAEKMMDHMDMELRDEFRKRIVKIFDE